MVDSESRQYIGNCETKRSLLLALYSHHSCLYMINHFGALVLFSSIFYNIYGITLCYGGSVRLTTSVSLFLVLRVSYLAPDRVYSRNDFQKM